MNMKSVFLGVAAVALLVMLAPAAQAQDPAKVAPDIYKCTFENEHTRLCEATFKPGAEIGMHSHPQHVVYVLKGGKLRITKADGTSEDGEFQVGQAVWMPAETHKAVNVGTTEVKALVIEYKGLPAKAKP